MKKNTLWQRSPAWLRWTLIAVLTVFFIAILSVPVTAVGAYWFMPSLYDRGLDQWRERGWEVTSAPLERSWDGLSITATLEGIAATHPQQNLDVAAKDIALRVDFGLFNNNVTLISDHTAVEMLDANDNIVRIDVNQAQASSVMQWFNGDISDAHWDADVSTGEALLSVHSDTAKALNGALETINILKSQAGQQLKVLENVVNNVINDTTKVINDVEELKDSLNSLDQENIRPLDLLQDKKTLLPKGIKPLGFSSPPSKDILRGHHGEDMLNFSTHQEPLAQAENNTEHADHQENGYGILHDLPIGFNFTTARREALGSRDAQLVSPVERNLVQYLWINTLAARLAIDITQEKIVDALSLTINDVDIVHQRESLLQNDIAVTLQEVSTAIDADFPRDSMVGSMKSQQLQPLCDALVAQTGSITLSSLNVATKNRSLLYAEAQTTLDNRYYPQGSATVRIPLDLPIAIAANGGDADQPVEIGVDFNQQNITLTQPFLPPQTLPQPTFLNMSALCARSF